MREYLESVGPRDSNERDTRGIGHANSKRGWRGNGGHYRRPDRGAFLHHLYRHAACEKNDPLARRYRRARQCTRQLVERIVATNVLAYGNDTARDIPKSRCVYRPRLDVEFLT